MPYLLKEVLDGLASTDASGRTLQLSGVLLGLHLVQGPLRVVWRLCILPPSHRACLQLRKKFHAHLLDLGVPYYEKNNAGSVLTLLNSDHEAIRMFLGPGLVVLVDGITYTVAIGVFLWVLAPSFVLWACIPLAIVPFLVGFFERRLRASTQEIQSKLSISAGIGQSWIEGVRLLKTKARESNALEIYRESSDVLRNKRVQYAFLQSCFQPSLDLVLAVGLIVFVYLGHDSLMAQTISVGTWVATTRYMQKLLWPLSAIALAVEHFQRAWVSYRRLDDFYALKADPYVPSRIDEGSLRSQILDAQIDQLGIVSNSAREISRIRNVMSTKVTSHAIEIRNLTFRYPHKQNLSLAIERLAIPKGEWLFLKGNNQSGKSTLLKILMRHYESYQGEIELFGRALHTYSRTDSRTFMACVDQEPELLSGTLYDNLRGFVSRQDSEITDQVKLSLHAAGLNHEFETGQLKANTEVGFRGKMLSGGQRQRSTLARALMRKPEILLLDDISASLDHETEEVLLEGLKAQRSSMTVLVVSQRPSIQRLCDRTYELREPVFVPREGV